MRQLVEYWGLRGVLGAIDALPYRGAVGLGRGAGGLWWLIDARRRRVATDNILKAGIERDRKKARRLARESFRNFGLVAIESLTSADFLEDERWREHLKLAIAPDVQEVLETPGQGMIMASGHFGSWEIAAHWLSRFKPVAGITRQMNNPRVEEVLKRRKPRYDFRPIPKYAAEPGRLVASLKNGEILALLTDQRPSSGGIDVPFFGHDAQTYQTVAMLHLVTRAPLCFAACRRLDATTFELSTSPLITHPRSGDKDRDTHEILRAINGHLEEVIRRSPEQYGWGHGRWRRANRRPGRSEG